MKSSHRKNHTETCSETGAALLFAIIALFVLLSVSAAMVGVATGESRAVFERSTQRVAFYYAESGLEAARYEISENVDLDGDGIGNHNRQFEEGTYAVSATDLGGGLWELDSTGNSGQGATTLREVVGFTKTTTFPIAAITMIGEFDKTKFKLKKHADVIIDGGDTPAMSFTDADVWKKIGEEFAKSIAKDDMPIENLSGFPMSEFTPKKKHGDTVDLPLHLLDNADGFESLAGLYNELVAQTNKLLPTAKPVPAEDPNKKAEKKNLDLTAIEGSNGVFVLKDMRLEKGESVTGSGTLLIDHELKIDKGAELNWTGNIIVMGDTKKHAKLEVHHGALNVTGNVIVLGEGKDHSELKIKHDSVANIEGSLFVGSSSEEKKGRKAKLSVEKGAHLNINGLLTLHGSKIHAKFKHDSDVTINGMVQVQVVEGKGKEDLKMEFDGTMEIRKDDEGIMTGLGALDSLGADFELPTLETLVSDQVVTFAWEQLH